MGRPKHRPVVRMRHDNVSGRNEGEADAKKPEHEMTVEEIKKQLLDVLQSMPNDLIKDFFVKKLKNNVVSGYQSAAMHIDTIKPATVPAMKYVLTELLEYLKASGNVRSNNPGQDSENKGGSEGEGNSTQKDGDGAAEEEEGEYPGPIENIEDYSGGDFNPDNMQEVMQEKIKKTIVYLEDLLRRIKRCEERLDTQSEAIVLLKQGVESLQAFKAELPDFMAAQMIKIVSDMDLGNASNMGPKTGYFEVKFPAEAARAVKGVVPAEWNRILQLATARENILLVGPTGCGKTHIAELLSQALNLEFYSVSCSEGMSENELKGWLLPLGEKGEWIYVSSDFVTAYECGGVFNLDEMDASDPNVLTWLNKAIGGKSFHLAMRKGNSLVRKHKDFVLIGCANTMGSGADMVYVGRNQLDGATRDRFKAGIITMDYSEVVEESIIDEDVLMWGRYIRKALLALKDQAHHMSTRTMISFTNMKRTHNWINKDWEQAYFADWSSSDRSRLNNVIKDIITKDIEQEKLTARRGSV